MNFKCKNKGGNISMRIEEWRNTIVITRKWVENDKRHGPLAAQRLPKFDRRRTKYLRSRFPPRRGWFWQRFEIRRVRLISRLGWEEVCCVCAAHVSRFPAHVSAVETEMQVVRDGTSLSMADKQITRSVETNEIIALKGTFQDNNT